MKKEEEKEQESEKIPRKLNKILIERIRKYEIQDTSQLVNGPNDGDTNNWYFGGLINFDGNNNNSNTSGYEISNDIDNMTENDIYIEPYQYNEFRELDEEEEENEENEKEQANEDNKINLEKNLEKYKIKYDLNKEDKNAKNIRLILSDNYNQYLDKLQKNYNKYENNHFPKIIINDKNHHKKAILKNEKEKIYNTRSGEKIIINENTYTTSLAYLKNKDLFDDIPPRYKKIKEEFTLDYNLLEEEAINIQIKSMEFIELNSKVSTSMSKILLFSSYLEHYINDKLEPFNNSINISYDKVTKDKKYISEIKEKTMRNSGNIILRRLKMDNTKKLIIELKKYIKLKKSMNSLEALFSGKKNTQQIYDLINNCREEITKIKEINEKKNMKESLIEIFEKKLEEFKNLNDANMSGELSELLNYYFKTFLFFKSQKEEMPSEETCFQEFEKYGVTKFVLDKVKSISNKYDYILSDLCFSSNEEEKEKISKICDYYIEGDLISKIYIQLKGIFTSLCDQEMQYILTIFREKLMNQDNEQNKIDKKDNIKDENNNNNQEKNEKENNDKNKDEENNNNIEEKEKENKNEEQNNEKDKDKIEENNISEENIINNEIFVLLCIIISKNKLKEILLSFINVILSKIEKSDIIDKILKNKIIKECQDIKAIIDNNIKDIVKDQIQICLSKVSLNNDTNLDKFINNFYLILELIKDEISQYEDSDNKSNNKLIKIIIREQKYFIENWTKKNLAKFENESYKSWESLKNIPPKYQNILNVFFSFDIDNNCIKNETIIKKYPSEKINLIKEAIEDEENNNEEENEANEGLLNIKDGDKPELKLKINKISLDIINFAFDILKMFTLFHKECYAIILGNMAVIIISHINFQNEQIYDGEYNQEITHHEISMAYGIVTLIEYIYEHIKDNEFFVEIAKNSKPKLIDSYLELTKNINRSKETSKKRIEEILENQCIKASLNKLLQIELPNYEAILGDVPVKDYALSFVSSLKEIYTSMINCYEEAFIKEMVNKALEDFFDKFEEFIFHGQKIEEENCLRQFKRDMIFLKKNLVFITVVDLTDVKNRIDNINKSVLPESMLKTKKK